MLDLKLYYSELYADEAMLLELRSFFFKWLTVFSQSLLDPDTNPLLKAKHIRKYIDIYIRIYRSII